MNKSILFLLLAMAFLPRSAFGADGLISIESSYAVAETADRVEGILGQKGMTVFNRIDHSAAAHKAGVELRDTTLIIFGNPSVGSPLMKCAQTTAIDLPQKALVWKDAGNKVWISYNDPKYIAKRHGVTDCEEVLTKIGNALARMMGKAAAR